MNFKTKIMTKILVITLILFSFSLGAFAQNVNIPDANFKAYLVGDSNINTNGDTEIQVSEATAFTGMINVGFMNISDLTGIEAFTSLTDLRLTSNSITTIDVSQNTALVTLRVNVNNLTALDVSQNTALVELFCDSNSNLSSLDVSQNVNLEILGLDGTNLTSIDLSQNTALKKLNSNQDFTSLDVSNNTALIELNVISTNLTALDVSNNSLLETIAASFSNIVLLDLSQNTNLVSINCNNMANLSGLILKNLIPSQVFLFGPNNPNLTCIEVDDVTDATANWTNIDATASFNLDCGTLGINDLELSKNISIYPNPAQSQIQLISNETMKSVTIIDLFGKTIKSSLTSTSSIDISDLSRGVYFLRIYTDKGMAIKKIIKN